MLRDRQSSAAASLPPVAGRKTSIALETAVSFVYFLPDFADMASDRIVSSYYAF
jgi:hypothetical protein